MRTGVTNNPGGRPKYTGEWSDAVRKVLHEVREVSPGVRKKKLHLAAEKLVEAAIAGDISALREVADRIDGKSMQAVVASVGVSEGADIAAILTPARRRTGRVDWDLLPGEAEG